MNNYTQKVDKVGTDEVFPYPIKLEYDDEYVYLTILKIPDNIKPIDNNRQDYSDLKIYLCLESSTARKLYKQGSCNNYYYEKHPCKGGKFYLSMYTNPHEIINPEVGKTYSFKSDGSGVQRHLAHYWENGYWYKVRGTLRLGRNERWLYRTNVYSNIATIHVKPET